MAIVKVNFEAVRYLVAKAIFEKDETCKVIVNVACYGRRGTGFNNLIENPYSRTGDSPRPLNIICDKLESVAGKEWYKLIRTDSGLLAIKDALFNGKIDKELYKEEFSQDDRGLLIWLRYEESKFVSKYIDVYF